MVQKRGTTEAKKSARMTSHNRADERHDANRNRQRQRETANYERRRAGQVTPWEAARILRKQRRAEDRARTPRGMS